MIRVLVDAWIHRLLPASFALVGASRRRGTTRWGGFATRRSSFLHRRTCATFTFALLLALSLLLLDSLLSLACSHHSNQFSGSSFLAPWRDHGQGVQSSNNTRTKVRSESASVPTYLPGGCATRQKWTGSSPPMIKGPLFGAARGEGSSSCSHSSPLNPRTSKDIVIGGKYF